MTTSPPVSPPLDPLVLTPFDGPTAPDDVADQIKVVAPPPPPPAAEIPAPAPVIEVTKH